MLGVNPSVVVDDIKKGMDGELPCLTGGRHGDWYVVESWELEGERLAAHKARLSDGDNLAVVSGQGEAPTHTSEASDGIPRPRP